MIDDIMGELKADIAKSHDVLKNSLSRVRTGRANANVAGRCASRLLGNADAHRPDGHGQRSRAAHDLDQGLGQAEREGRGEGDHPERSGPQSSGRRRPAAPAHAAAQRRAASRSTKVVRKTGEEAKVGIRKHRQDARALLENLKDEGEAGEDDVDRALKKVDELVQAGTATVDEIVARKEKDIMEV